MCVCVCVCVCVAGIPVQTPEECIRGKGLEGCVCNRCKRQWGEPGVDAQFYPVDSPFSRSAQDFPSYNRTLNAKPEPRQDMDGIDDRCVWACAPLPFSPSGPPT